MSIQADSSLPESQELELKLTIHPQDVDQLINSHIFQSMLSESSSEENRLKNVYFDTSTADLSKNKIALRIRYKKGRYIQTLKTVGNTVGGVHQRGEWEWDVDSPDLNFQLLSQPHWPEGVQGLENKLKPVFNTDFSRQSAVLTP